MIGIHDSLIVQGKEGLLIAGKKRTDEDIQFIYREAQNQTAPALFENSELYKSEKIKQDPYKWVKTPWGSYSVIKKEGLFKYKKLKIKAGQQLSYQSHQNRKEHWIVLEGQAEAIVDGVKKKLQCHEHLFIDQGIKHRLKNPTDYNLTVLEIQMGSYLEEDDIIRYEDDYGRT